MFYIYTDVVFLDSPFIYLFKILAKRQKPVHQLMITIEKHIICPVSIQIGLEIV